MDGQQTEGHRDDLIT